MTKKKGRKEEISKKLIKKEAAEKPQGKKEEAAKLTKKEGLIDRIFKKAEVEKAPSKKEEMVGSKEMEKVAEPKVSAEEEIIEKEFGKTEEAKEKIDGKKEEAAKVTKKEGLIDRIFKKAEVEKAPSKKEEIGKAEVKKIAEPQIVAEAQKEAPEKEAPQPKEAGVSRDEIKKECAGINKLWGDFTHSVGVGWKEIGRIKKEAYAPNMTSYQDREKELYGKLEKSRNEVRAALDELHRILGKYEERVKYKDEAEAELQALEEVKVMLGEKLKNVSKRIERIRVRPNSDLTKLFAEAKECEDEVKRSDDDILDFEREYTKFLGMMGKIGG